MKRLGLMAAMMLAPVLASAGLTAILSAVPSSLPNGQIITVSMVVQAGAQYPVDGVAPSAIGMQGSASAVLVSGPSPSSANLAANGSQVFTYTYSATGCGSIVFSGSAGGTENSSPVSSNSSSSSTITVCPGTPTPTPVVSPTPTATPTLWVVYVTPNEGPEPGEASIPGNVYHPLDGAKLELKYSAPYPGKLAISIYNRLGSRVRRLEREVWAGQGSEYWDGRGDEGGVVGAGVYLAHFQAKGLNKAVKLVVVK